MAISGVDPKCYILALFVRDDGTRFLLGDDPYEFKDKQLHFQPNTMANDVVEVQGNDGYLLAGQVRRPGTQSFDGYVGNGTNSKAEVEAKRRDFLQFFRRSHFYKVIYVFPNGTAIQRKQGFLVDDPTVQELYQQYPEYHVALNFEDVNYYTYEEDDQGHEIYAEEAIIRLVGGGATGGLIWDENGVVWESPWGESTTVSGTDFQIDNLLPVRVPISDVELQGDTFQQTYSGKNLFDKSSVTIYNGYFSGGAQIRSGGVSDLTEGSDRFFYIPCEPNTTYTITKPTQNTTSNNRFRVGTQQVLNIANGAALSDFWSMTDGGTTTTHTITVGPNAYYLFVYFGKATTKTDPGGEMQDVLDGIQIEKGSTPTSYEKFVGGVPAPNPDFPQDVQTVTGEQIVTVSDGGEQEQYLIGLHGKNIFDVDNYDIVIAYIDNSGNIVDSTTDALLNPIAVSEGDKLTISLANGTFQNIGVAYFNGATFLSRANLGVATSFTVTAPSDCNIVRFWVRLQNVSPITYDAVKNAQIQIERGEATAYEAYTPIELCKIGDYQDYIYKGNDGWYVRKEVRHLSLAVANMNNSENYPGWKNQTQLQEDLGSPTYGSLSAGTSYFTNMSVFTEKGTGGDTAVGLANNGSTLHLRKTYFGDDFSQTYWKTNYPNSIFDLYYQIIVPIADTKITNADLVAQLEALGTMRLFIGGNNILVTSAGSNLPATLQFDYYTQYVPLGAEWEEGGTKGPTIVDVNAIDNTYPVWELTGPAINPTLSVLTTNTTLTYNGTITASQTLVIDMFNKTATLNGTSVIGNVSGDWVYMAPGTNRVAYTAGNTDAPDSKISWQEVVG